MVQYKDDKIAPCIKHTARYLWYIYVGSTILCVVGYIAAGMDLFDAIAHSLTTISTGGFSTHDASIGYFHNHWIELNADVFMLIIIILSLLMFGFLLNSSTHKFISNDLNQAIFHIISFITTTGYANDIAIWIFSSAMILGRLEYFTILVLFTSGFWRA